MIMDVALSERFKKLHAAEDRIAELDRAIAYMGIWNARIDTLDEERARLTRFVIAERKALGVKDAGRYSA
jgi:hypothetical protein